MRPLRSQDIPAEVPNEHSPGLPAYRLTGLPAYRLTRRKAISPIPQDTQTIPRLPSSRVIETGPETPADIRVEPPRARPADREAEPAEDGGAAPVQHAPAATTPREDAERARQEKIFRDSQQALATLDTRRQQRDGYEDRDAADMRKAITRNMQNAQAALGEAPPSLPPDQQAAW